MRPAEWFDGSGTDGATVQHPGETRASGIAPACTQVRSTKLEPCNNACFLFFKHVCLYVYTWLSVHANMHVIHFTHSYIHRY